MSWQNSLIRDIQYVSWLATFGPGTGSPHHSGLIRAVRPQRPVAAGLPVDHCSTEFPKALDPLPSLTSPFRDANAGRLTLLFTHSVDVSGDGSPI
jgi:hypothetical protein